MLGNKGVVGADVFGYVMLVVLVISMFYYFFDKMPPFYEHSLVQANMDKLQDAVNLACAFDDFHINVTMTVPKSTLEFRDDEICLNSEGSLRVCRLVFCTHPKNNTLELPKNPNLLLKRNSTGYYLEKSPS